MQADDAVNAINLLKSWVYNKLSSSYDENTALHILSLIIRQVTG